ncbi:hypothetical protein KUTeg_001061 [Tegillarca granosa]|uniref:Sulfotransferase domain-containing protein n=1 Tax=Tegillarca granosa TaxID=220873 RepID=A0ABQ9FVV2_TEGGR|nr:hypothetical protein KUTeg_001061 [Tegillarca granosa]
MMLELMEESIFDDKPSPRVLNTHIYYSQLPEDFKRRNCKIILCLRNPKDVMVSSYDLHSKLKLYNMSMKWENYFSMFLEGQIDYGSWFDYVLGWEKVTKENPDAPIHIVYYEDMHNEGDEQLYKDINTLCQFDKMKEEKGQWITENWVDNKPSWYRNGNTAERIQGMKQELMLEIMEERLFDDKPSPRVLNTHIYYSQLPEDFKRRNCKIILCLRNPKDVMVSLFNFHSKLKFFKMTIKWDNYMKMFLEGQIDYGSWFDYVLGWEKDGVKEIQKLAKFLGKEGDDQLYKDINTLCQFDRMKVEKDKGLAEKWVDNKPGWYRKGIVGDWKNWFTVAQNEYFNKIYEEKMAESKLKIQFEI